MKRVIVWGGVLLALCAGGRLWWHARCVATGRRTALPCQPLPPCIYTYKDMTYSLN
jgi:hypothetical protein